MFADRCLCIGKLPFEFLVMRTVKWLVSECIYLLATQTMCTSGHLQDTWRCMGLHCLIVDVTTYEQTQLFELQIWCHLRSREYMQFSWADIFQTVRSEITIFLLYPIFFSCCLDRMSFRALGLLILFYTRRVMALTATFFARHNILSLNSNHRSIQLFKC